MKKLLLLFFLAATLSSSFSQSSRCIVNATQDRAFCTGSSLTIGTHTYSVTGIYHDTLMSYSGCDSIITSQLYFVPVFSVFQNRNICPHDSVTIGTHTYTAYGTYIDTLTATGGCDSIVYTTVGPRSTIYSYQYPTFCGNGSVTVGAHTYTANGNYQDTLTTPGGCDSIVNTNLRVNVPYYFSQSFSICAGDSITVNAHTYSHTGSYSNTFTTATGCDSIVTTTIQVLDPESMPIYPNYITCGCGVEGSYVDYFSATAHYQWLDCDNNMAPLPGDTTWTVLPPLEGIVYHYAVSISDHGCVDTSDCADVEILIEGVNELNLVNDNVIIYPNPANDHINLEFNTSTEQSLSISIVNVLGASTYESEQTYPMGAHKMVIPLDAISNGVYLVKVSDGKNTVVKRIVVNH